MATVWSIGHGARSLAELLAVLDEKGIRTLADIRSFPGSRRHPHFGQAALAAALSAAGIEYVHLRSLGGRRRETGVSIHRALRVAAFRAYADHMATEEFRTGYVELGELARATPTAFMCAETLWWQCHRRMLSDRLVVDGWEVVHILASRKTGPHQLWDVARVAEGRLVYDVGTLPLDDTVENGGSRAS